jgi:hypothetical protein
MTRLEPPHPLSACQLKLDRAYEHAHTLEGEIKWFLKRDPHGPVAQPRPKTGEYVAWMKVREHPPLRWGIIIGEIVHNLRSALDQLFVQLVRANGKNPGGTAYPILTDDPDDPSADPRTRKRWKALRKVVHSNDFAIIERTQPYKGGQLFHDHPFLVLNRLSNWDKHTALHLAATILVESRIEFIAVKNCVLGPTKFRPEGPLVDRAVIAAAPITVLGPGEAEVHMDAELTYGVAFAEGGPPGTAGTEALEELIRVANAVHDIILEFGRSPRFTQS